MAAERALGRTRSSRHHNNPGFDILSDDPATGIRYFIEVKGHRPTTPEIKVSARRSARPNRTPTLPPRRRRVPDEPDGDPTVRYLIRPVRRRTTALRPDLRARSNVADLMPHAVEPQ